MRVAGWCSSRKDGEECVEFGLRFGGEDAEGSGETVAVLLRAAAAFPASLFGPVESFAFSRLASIWDSVDMLGNAPSYASLGYGCAERITRDRASVLKTREIGFWVDLSTAGG